MNASQTRQVTGIKDIIGLWRRSLICWPDGTSDTTTAVHWMQTPSLFVDLRQPANKPSFEGVQCLRDLHRAHVDWMARQEGFAGEVLWDGRHIEWQRRFDMQPRSAYPDAGKLWFEGGVMIEEGRDIPYVEHWHRDGSRPQPCAGIELRDTATGQAGVLVRVGNSFMYARARLTELPPLSDLRQLIGAASFVGDKQDLIDCEISLGVVGDEWRIERSSLPFKEGRHLKPRWTAEGPLLLTHDLDEEGNVAERRWTNVRTEGSLTELLCTARPSTQ